MKHLWLGLIALLCVAFSACGGGGGIDNPVRHPTLAPDVAGQVDQRGASALHQSSATDDLFVRVEVTNPNPNGTDIALIRFCLKFDPQEDNALTVQEATSYLQQPPAQLPENIDLQQVAYASNPQIIEITQFKGGALSPDQRYWISAVFVSEDGVPGPVTTPQRFKLIYRYQLVEPPVLGIVKIFEGTVSDHNGAGLRNAFVQYFHKGAFLEADLTDQYGHYYFEVTVPNPEGASSVRSVSCEESDDPTEYVLRVYHPYYTEELQKYLLPEYTHYYVDFAFPWQLYDHDQGGGGTI
jgi:hypothetical protein